MTKKREFKNEAAFQKWLVKQLRDEFKEQILVVPTTMTGYGMSGVGDLLICFLGMFWSVELKMDGKKPTPLQLQFAMKVDRAGGRTAIPVSPNPDKDGNGGVDNFLEYLRQVYLAKTGMQIVHGAKPEEIRAAIDDRLAELMKEEPELATELTEQIREMRGEAADGDQE